jgi:hypothetical protein
VRDNLVIVIMSGTRRLSGWTAPQSLLADRVYPRLRMVGPAALIGLSSDALVRTASERLESALPPWLDDLIEADRKSRGALIKTLEAYADADMNVLKTAKALSIHPNTIYARVQKINDITGRNALNYHALTELLLAAECAGQSQLSVSKYV